MLTWIWLILPCLALIAFGVALRRASELFAVRVQGGKLSVLRGRLPPALFSELSDIAERAPQSDAELCVVSESGTPRLLLRGAPQPALEQAARNVLGRYSVSQIRTGRLRAP